jgi:iron complex transport system ATP-binding protein
LIEAINLSVKIGKKQILKNLNFVIHEREKIAIIGPNGAGKTTLMRVLGGMLPYEGKLIINGKEISEYRRQDLAKLISYVPQIFYTPYTFTVEEFVKMGKYISIRNWWNAEEIDRYLDEVGILNLKARYVIMIMANGQLYGIFSGKSKEFVDAISRIYQIEYEILDGKFIVPKVP